MTIAIVCIFVHLLVMIGCCCTRYLGESISERERKKGQLHKVFTDSFEKIRAIRFPVVIKVDNIGVGGQTPMRHPPIVVVKEVPDSMEN